METIELKLFVCGDTLRHKNARLLLESMCEDRFRGRYALEVIDVLEAPWKAEGYKVIATPMVLKKRPEPERRVIGDICDSHEFLMALDLETEEGRREG